MCQLYNYLGSFGIIVLVFEIVFVIFFIYFLITEIIKLKNEKLGYFKKFWNLNEFTIIIFSIISMVMFGMRTVFTTLAIKEVHESELGEFVNFNTIGLWDETFTNVQAIVVFCATLKFLKLLRFNKHIGMIAGALRLATRDLLGFSITFGIVFMAFTQFGYLIFGTMTKSYSTFMSSLQTIFRFSLGQFNLKELQDANYVLGSVYFILFVLIVFMGLMSMFVTILNEAFEKIKAEFENNNPDREIIDFIFESVKKIGKKGKNKKGKQISPDVGASTESLRVTIRKEMNPNETFYSTSSKSLNQTHSQYYDNDSMSLY